MPRADKDELHELLTGQEPHYKYVKDPKQCTIVGVGFSGGQDKQGVEFGAIHIAEKGIFTQITSLGWTCTINNQLAITTHHRPSSDPPIANCKNPRFVANVTRELADIVTETVQKGAMCLTLGGDHSLGMGTMVGVGRVHKDFGVIWVDAHADLNVPQSSPSGNLHGCPVAFAMHLPGTEAIEPLASWIPHVLTPDRLVYIGLRDVDEGEKKFIKELGITAFSMHHVDRFGIGKVMEMALEHLGNRPIHLSYDVDGIDPSFVQATGTPVRGGLTFREANYITEAVAASGNLVAMDIVEVNPSLSKGKEKYVEQTVATACSLARCALGETLL